MYQLRKAPYGVRINFEETVTAEEMKRFDQDATAMLANLPANFGVLVDERKLRPGGIPTGSEAEQILGKVQNKYRVRGMKRSCVILQSASVTMQMERRARESGILNVERYINAKEEPHWETKALAWIEQGKDPN